MEPQYNVMLCSGQKDPLELPESIEKAKAMLPVLRIDMESFERSYHRMLSQKERGRVSEEEFERWERRWEAARLMTERRHSLLAAWVHATEQLTDNERNAAETTRTIAVLKLENERLKSEIEQLKTTTLTNVIDARYRKDNRDAVEKLKASTLHIKNLQGAYDALSAKYQKLQETLAKPAQQTPRDASEDYKKKARRALHESFCVTIALLNNIEQQTGTLPEVAKEERESLIVSLPENFYENWKSDRGHKFFGKDRADG